MEDDGEEVEEPRSLMPFEGRLVGIFGVRGPVKRIKGRDIGLADFAELEDESEEEGDEAEVEGKCGLCLAWIPAEERYAVHTFDGVVASLPEANLRAWAPPPVEEGGFDLLLPPTAMPADFADMLSGELNSKGFCVVQTFLSPRERFAAMRAAEGKNGDRPFSRLQQEVEAGYLGYDNNTKVAPLVEDDAVEPGDVLEACSRQMLSVGLSMSMATESLGFSCAGFRRTLLRMSIDKIDEDELFAEALADMENEGDWSQPIQEFVRFVQQRRASLLFMVQNDGGDLWLYPKEFADKRSYRIPIAPNRLLIFRHDLMDYSYQVRGRSLALQTWALEELRNAQQFKQISLTFPSPGERGMVIINPGPSVPDGPKASVMSLATRMPGEAWDPWHYWLMFASGSDSCSRWPYCRWDYEPYYEEGCDSNATGKSYTCHGGFVSQEQITQFDNDFFGIGLDEAKSMVPGQWMSLEVGYMCLRSAGLTARTLKGRRLGVWYGDVGPDWGSFQTEWARFFPGVCATTLATNMSNAGTAGRLSHIFDLKGPISSYDTACSASLVAMNAAHLLMFKPEGGDVEDQEALVTGVNTLLGPSSFIGNCMATMLSHQGRSFSFNRSADGYQRGEGCGSIYFKLFKGDRRDEEKRVCTLIGTATNQDGRSASLTAPNGPAQQAVIRKSMAFAGINPNTVSIAECHGTGTALGDPIEVGALMAVMHKREFPILKTSAKSNIAHLEAGAGIAGLTKCIMMINVATAPPNCHFNVINAHLTVDGYPVYFDSECINTDFSSLYCGVSSFGFGGTNSRADVYGYATKGHRASIRVELPKLSPPRVLPIGQPVYIFGTWSRWSTFTRMDGGRKGPYTCSVMLGDSRRELFQLCCDEAGFETIHPLVADADQNCQVVGPDWDGKGLSFLIDGRKDRVPAGTVYDISFMWGEDRKSVSWQPSTAPPKPQAEGDEDGEEGHAAIGNDCHHRYYLAGSFKKWQGFTELRPLGDGIFEVCFRMGPKNAESFQIVRDQDMSQVLYPAGGDGVQATKTDVPICGPDENHTDADGLRRCWVVRAPQHEEVTVRLCTKDANYSVTVTCFRPGVGDFSSVWEGWEAWARGAGRTFFAAGSLSGVSLLPMEPSRTDPGVHTCSVALDHRGFAGFRIDVGEGRSLALHPDASNELTASAPHDNLSLWWVTGIPGATYEVRLDLAEGDRSRMVTWRPLGDQSIAH